MILSFLFPYKFFPLYTVDFFGDESLPAFQEPPTPRPAFSFYLTPFIHNFVIHSISMLLYGARAFFKTEEPSTR